MRFEAVMNTARLILMGLFIGPMIACAIADSSPPMQYILLNRAPGVRWNQNRPDSIDADGFEEIKNAFDAENSGPIRIGVSFIFSYLASPPQTVEASLKQCLALAAQTETPIVIQLDGENWWQARSDLWNWWDPDRPGFNPANRSNVEWTSWSQADAVKICWRNWGRQIRVLPQPNLMSPAYLQTCREDTRRISSLVMDWFDKLPPSKKHLFVGLKLGHESSIGVNAWHYPMGNSFLTEPVADDPQAGLDHDKGLSRGVAQLGYAAVRTAGLRSQGRIAEDDIVEVVRRYLLALCREARSAGLPRERLFTHGAGWKDGEKLYDAAVNDLSCPGWSFYKYAHDPRQDAAVQRNLERSDALYWAAPEWLYMGPGGAEAWQNALQNTLGDTRCRYVCIFNWEGIEKNQQALDGIRRVLLAGKERP
ncbi:MAG: hypothetical protein JW828_15205 [Sedimentisphaerales bacterium]|nr:hypothetical protein [Sedimentisphaerales bacterium]